MHTYNTAYYFDVHLYASHFASLLGWVSNALFHFLLSFVIIVRMQVGIMTIFFLLFVNATIKFSLRRFWYCHKLKKCKTPNTHSAIKCVIRKKNISVIVCVTASLWLNTNKLRCTFHFFYLLDMHMMYTKHRLHKSSLVSYVKAHRHLHLHRLLTES